MLRLTFTTVWIYSSRKVPHFATVHTSTRNLYVKTKLQNRRFSRSIIKGKKLTSSYNTYNNNTLFSNKDLESSSRYGGYYVRFQSSRPASVAAAAAATRTATESPMDEETKTTTTSKFSTKKVLEVKKKSSLSSKTKTTSSSSSTTSSLPPTSQSTLNQKINFKKILNSSSSSNPPQRSLNDLLTPPKPLKLLNAVDATVLNQLYVKSPNLISVYLGLSKSRLTSFIVITAMAGYSLSPSASLLNPDLIWIGLGTFMTSSSANTFNQVIERDYDGLMDRTKNRALVRKLVSPQHAIWFGLISGSLGMMSLYSVNELAALIGLCNLVLYTCAYTPLKRRHIANTWVGAVVGALPPLIGYAGACNFIDARALILASIMFCWQFPHFNALSWNLRKEYDRAGYKMMCFVNERLCRQTTLRYSVILSAICVSSCLMGVTHWSFVLDSGLLNAYLCYLSWQFYKNPDAKTSRKLFRYSLIHLPVLIIFLILGKTTTTGTATAAAGVESSKKESESVLPVSAAI